MELDKRMEVDDSRITKIRRSLTRVLTSSDDQIAQVTRLLPRQARMFTTETVVDFNAETMRGLTVMELEAADRPGLLSTVGKVFIDQGVDIDAAKIMTIGERAEDVFYICDESGSPLDDEAKARLQAGLVRAIDDGGPTETGT